MNCLYLCRMQEFFFTVLTIWVIWRLFSAFSESGRTERKNVFYKNEQHHHHYHQDKREGEVKVEVKSEPARKSKGDADGEYVDYEEIK